MADDLVSCAGPAERQPPRKEEKRQRSIFEVPPDFFDSCRLLPSLDSPPETSETLAVSAIEKLAIGEEVDSDERNSTATKASTLRWTCNTCTAEFESLQDQRSHFKSDLHRFNVKLSIAGKDAVKEEDFDELTSDSLFKDYDISSISGSEDETERGLLPHNNLHSGLCGNVKKKLLIRLQSGEKVSIWKCLLLDEAENILFENDKSVAADNGGLVPCMGEKEVTEKLKFLIHEPRNNTRLRIVLLASGGHFAGCVFDGNSIVAHKTFHRYVIRAKAGKKQSSKDASGKAAHSAGASLRRHNELALKKEIQELLAAWRPHFDASSCVFIYAPSNNRQLLFDGEKPYFSYKHCAIRHVPLTVRRPTLKEARRVYNLLTQVFYEVDEDNTSMNKEDSQLTVTIPTDGCPESIKESLGDDLDCRGTSSGVKECDVLSISSGSESEVIGISTPLHEAAKSGNVHKVLELLELGLDPCLKDERGRTPFMLASEKEVRNTFRRFMASNLDKWDWHAAKVPSALTKEMEESQAAKQAEAALSRNGPTATISQNRGGSASTVTKQQYHLSNKAQMSTQEELKRKQAEEREKRAAAAERRIAAAAALNAQGTGTNTSLPKGAVTTDIPCSCCNTSLLGTVPFHRYNYKYCSTSCMHVHKEALEDG